MQARSFIRSLLMCLAGIISVVFLAMALRPLPKAAIGNCETHTGIVTGVLLDDKTNDILVKLHDDGNHYYINRGIESGLSLQELKMNLENKKAELHTIRHWTPLDPVSSSKHIAQIRMGGSILYSEF